MKKNTNLTKALLQTFTLLLLLPNILSADETSLEKSFLTPNNYFSDISINYFDWSSNTVEKTDKRNFTALEIEGGADWDWGDFYIYVDLENPAGKYHESSSSAQRIVYKPVLNVKLYENFALHIHDYNFHSNNYYVHNLITGFSYKIKTDFGLVAVPFIGSHYQESSYYSGYNGIMAGWNFAYPFVVYEQNFSLSQWHEMTFARNEQDGYENKNGIQGALSFWWHPNAVITTGIQYRYAKNELGYEEYQEGLIYTLKYNF